VPAEDLGSGKRRSMYSHPDSPHMDILTQFESRAPAKHEATRPATEASITAHCSGVHVADIFFCCTNCDTFFFTAK
jgi:hypothetical protein